MAVRLILLLSPEHGSPHDNIRSTAKLFRITNPDIIELPPKSGMRRFEISDGMTDAQGELFPHTCDLP